MGPTQTTSAKEATLVTDTSRDAIFLIHSTEPETRDLLLLNATLPGTIDRLGTLKIEDSPRFLQPGKPLEVT